MATPRLPFYATPVVATAAPPSASFTCFGYAWHDVVTRVEAFAIEATDRILEVENLTHAETRQSLTQYVQNLSSHLFLLHPGEAVVQVDVCYTKEVVTALKLYTTKRVTPWYGACRGERVSFRADDGLCINALRGRYGPNGCVELGVVYAPEEIAGEGHNIAESELMSRRLSIAQENRPSPTTIHTFDLAPRAVVIKTNADSVQSVRIVTPPEYDRLIRFPDSFPHDATEQWLVLVDGERLEAIGLDIKGNCIKAVRFRTNLQTSHMYGTGNNASTFWLDCADIGGFEFEADDDNNITKFAILEEAPSLRR